MRSKLPYLQQQIWELVQRTNLKADLDMRTMLTRERGDHTHEWDDALTPEGVPTTLASMTGNEVAHLMEDLDGYLCELGMAKIRDGLHILGEMPPLPEMLRSLTRLANIGVPSLQASLSAAFGFELPVLLDRPGNRLGENQQLLGMTCYTHADVLETLDRVSLDLFTMLETFGFRTATIDDVQHAVLGFETEDITKVLNFACVGLVPKLEQTGDEIEHLLDALEGKYIAAGAAGAPTRGMAHVLPTGRNFYAVDPRALPSQAAWRVGQQLAREAIERFRAEENKYRDGAQRLGHLTDADARRRYCASLRSLGSATVSMLTRSFKHGEEVAIIVFRGTSAEVVLEPTSNLADAFTTLEYLPTGGRTPLAHGLALSKSYVTPKTILILMTDGRANYPMRGGDPWQGALDTALELNCAILVVDTEASSRPLSQAKVLATAVNARCLTLDELAAIGDMAIELSS